MFRCRSLSCHAACLPLKCLKLGTKLEVVGRILGHSSVGITADIYRHVTTEEMHEALRRFGPLNGGETPE